MITIILFLVCAFIFMIWFGPSNFQSYAYISLVLAALAPVFSTLYTALV